MNIKINKLKADKISDIIQITKDTLGDYTAKQIADILENKKEVNLLDFDNFVNSFLTQDRWERGKIIRQIHSILF